MSNAPAAKAEGRSKFVPVPIRALNDERLGARHWRVLAIVALHDRMNKNGQGCWASNRRLAQETDLEYTRVADTISDLRAFGYITSEINPQNRNFRVHRVVYDDPTLGQQAKGLEGYPQKGQPFANRQMVQAQPFAKMGPNPLPLQRGKSLKSEAGTAPKHILTEADKKDGAFKVGTSRNNA